MSDTITINVEALQPLVADLRTITAAFAERMAGCQAIGAALAESAEGYHRFHADLLALCAERPPLIPVPTRRTP